MCNKKQNHFQMKSKYNPFIKPFKKTELHRKTKTLKSNYLGSLLKRKYSIYLLPTCKSVWALFCKSLCDTLTEQNLGINMKSLKVKD